jgi:hypothetical protein
MDWTASVTLPKPAVKLWGWSASRGPVVVMLVRSVDGKTFRYIDDQTMPVTDLEQWAYAVAPDETA